MAAQKIPVMLVTGSLGSGKTTLVKRILENAARTAVLMNEFGEIAIDSRIIKGENIDIIELAGGCACCSMTGEFEAAMREIVEKIAPSMILVEATGVAESDALVYEIEDNLPEVRLDLVVCIVDSYLSIRHPSVGYTARTQIVAADIILLNKADLVTADEMQIVEAQVRRYNDRAFLFRTTACNVDWQALFGLKTGARPRLEVTRDEEPLQSFAWFSSKVLNAEKFEDMVRELPEQVFRAKGFVRFPDGERLFNYVVGRADYEEFPADGTRLVFIGRDMDSVRAEITERLRQCEVE